MRTGAAYVQGYIDGFDQSELLALGLDIIDAYIFQWYLDFAGSGRCSRSGTGAATSLCRKERYTTWCAIKRF